MSRLLWCSSKLCLSSVSDITSVADDQCTTMEVSVYFIVSYLIFFSNPGFATTEVYAKGGIIRAVGDINIFPTSAQSEYEKSYWQGSTMVPTNYTGIVTSYVTDKAIVPSPSRSPEKFVSSSDCDETRANAVACLKIFPVTPESRYERMYCMSSTDIRKKTNNKHKCNCETCKPNVHCWMSCQTLAKFGEAPESDCFCTPLTGGDGDGPIPAWCVSPQGQIEFFTECHSPSFHYSCELYKNFFENSFSLTRDHYKIWKSFSCKGKTVEKSLISCLSNTLVTVVRKRSVACDVPYNGITSCLESFRKKLGLSSQQLCQEAIQIWDQMPSNYFQLSNADFENVFSTTRSKVNECLRVLT
ncbi:uncharacterized protein LOC132561097 [Ylistrum balloti]|uniref:uncharacterized protein LOC132561097 n=1 Tax=Ylistrum balloti TaxID=509963 RepID=UPI002905CAD8|nr:uncharacterized protein LOC132561097 [Ylistrum balloti]